MMSRKSVVAIVVAVVLAALGLGSPVSAACWFEGGCHICACCVTDGSGGCNYTAWACSDGTGGENETCWTW